MKKLVLFAALLGAAMPVAVQAQAVFAPSGNVTADHDPNNPVSLGNMFTPTVNGFATSLGFYTPTNLVGGGEQVALYDANGNQLASTFVAVALNTPGQYFYQSIAPVALTAGLQYMVVNFVGNNAWAFGSVTTTNATYNGNAYNYGPALAYPTSTAGASGPAYLGPNLTIAAVPEPATWGLMIVGFGAVGGAMRRRAKVRTSVRFA